MNAATAGASSGLARCQLHRDEVAGWQCTACQAPLCPDCAAEVVPERGSPYVTCCHCGSLAQILTRPRSKAMSFMQRLLLVPLYPFSRSGLVALTMLAATLGLLSFLGIGFAAIYVFILKQGIYWSYVFYLIRNTGNGIIRYGTPDFRSISEDVVMPFVRGIVGTSLVWLPAVLYIVVSPWTWQDIGQLRILRDPILWLFAIGGVLYAPMALIAAATDIGVFDMLNPVLIVSYIRRVGSDYFVALLGLAILLPVQIVFVMLISGVAALIPLPFVGGWLTAIASLYPTFVWAHVLGTVLYVHGHALDWGTEESYWEPILSGVTPRGQRVVPVPRAHIAPLAPLATLPLAADPFAPTGGAGYGPPPGVQPGFAPSPVRTSIPLSLDPPVDFVPGPAPAPVPQAKSRPPEPVPAEPRSAPLGAEPTHEPEPDHTEPPPGRPPVDSAVPNPFANPADSGVIRMPEFLGPAAPIKAALASKDFAKAVELFAQDPHTLGPHLSTAETFLLSAALAQHKQVPLAIGALKRIAFSADPVAPKAMFLLARLYVDARKDYDNAERLFRTLLQKFPDSREADGARAHLKKLGY